MTGVQALWLREVLRFGRQRSRVTGALLQPIVFWLLLGAGLSGSFRPGGSTDASYLQYFSPGALALVLLFTAIFATISVVEDRRSGFLQGVLVAPITRARIVLAQALGATTVAVLQALLFLALAPLAGVPMTVAGLAGTLIAAALVAFALSNLGLAIAWRMDSTQGFHAIMNLLLLPIWFLSGAFFPEAGVGWVLKAAMVVNPLTYGVGLLRRALYAGSAAAVPVDVPGLAVCAVVTVAFAVAMAWLATAVARRSSTLD
jgi:ABC-2 type transport system permease protein